MIFSPKIDWLENNIIRPKRGEGSYPKITIITPSYNQGEFIEATIRSVLAQNYPNLEYLIFDGGSTDNTIDVIKKYDAHITYWESKKDNGQSHAINKGFEIASGEIVGWLNSDDLFYQDTLHCVADCFKDGNYRKIIFGEGTYLFDKYQLSIKNTTAKLSLDHSITLCDYVIQPSTFWGKSVIDEIGTLDENLHYGFDWDWFIKAHTNAIPFEMIERNLSVYRIHAGHKSSSGGEKRIEELASIFKKNHGEFVANAYLKLNKSEKHILLKRLLKRMPFEVGFLKKFYWRRGFSSIPYSVFKSILMM